MTAIVYLAIAAAVLIVVGPLALGFVRRYRRDPADPVFGEGRDDA